MIPYLATGTVYAKVGAGSSCYLTNEALDNAILMIGNNCTVSDFLVGVLHNITDCLFCKNTIVSMISFDINPIGLARHSLRVPQSLLALPKDTR